MPVAKPELGTKRVCPSCGTKYYDLKRNPITCPSCGTIFEIVAPKASTARRRAAAAAAPVAEAVIEREPDTISLEDAEAEENEAEVVANEDEEALPEEAEALEVETEPAAEDDAAFLPEEEEEEGDVAGLLDVNAEDEDEV